LTCTSLSSWEEGAKGEERGKAARVFFETSGQRALTVSWGRGTIVKSGRAGGTETRGGWSLLGKKKLPTQGKKLRD